MWQLMPPFNARELERSNKESFFPKRSHHLVLSVDPMARWPQFPPDTSPQSQGATLET